MITDPEDRAVVLLLVAIRQSIGLSVADVAARMSSTPEFVAAIERGEEDPSVSTLQRYARATGAVLTLAADEGAS